MKLGLVPVVDVAPLYLGMKHGFFAEQGLKIEPQVTLGFGANVASVVSGSTQLGFAATVPIINGIASGAPIRIVANSDVLGKLPDGDATGLMVLQDSPIKNVKDLAGKTVAVNALNTINDVAIKYMMKRDGGDPASIKFIQIPMPNMVNALTAKQVDAIGAVEPFVTAAKQAGARVLVNTSTGAYPLGTPIASYFVGKKWAEENPKLVKGFVAGLAKSTEYAREHPDETRAIIATYTKIPPDLLEKIVLGEFDVDLHEEQMGAIIKIMTAVGLLQTQVSVSDIVDNGDG